MMDEVKGKILSSIIIAIALVTCTFILKDAYINKNTDQMQLSLPSLNIDLSNLEDALKVTNKDILSVSETAQYLGIKEEDFISMLYNGKLSSLPYVSIEGRVIFSKKALNDWFEKAAKEHYSIKPVD